MGKIVAENGVIDEDYFFATTFPKIVKNSIFLLNLYQQFSKFSQNFPNICVFRPNARKVNSGFKTF